MSHTQRFGQPIDLVRFLLSLSVTLETANEAMANHQMRSAIIAVAIAQRLGFRSDRIRDVFFAAILHDVGALAPEEKFELHSGNADYIQRHTSIGRELLKGVAHFERASSIVGLHHSPWRRTVEEAHADLALEASIVALADTAERSIRRGTYILHQDRAITASIRKEGGREFSPEATEAFLDISGREAFWLELAASRGHLGLEAALPFGELKIPRAEVLGLSVFVRKIIDFRSPFTATHSSGVSAAASQLGGRLGFDEAERRDLEVAGNIHDIGKMSVDDRILLKPSGLNSGESALMRQHSYHSYRFIRESGIGLKVAAWAGFHHERLDGSGYPFHHGLSAMDLGARILAVADVVTALAEDRPYRRGLGREEALAIAKNMAAAGSLDPEVVAALTGSYDLVVGAAMVAQGVAAEEYLSRVRSAVS
jgi:HD-GYP domain-containing protein (c-di-GMP phosphodiesterase class II)